MPTRGAEGAGGRGVWGGVGARLGRTTYAVRPEFAHARSNWPR